MRLLDGVLALFKGRGGCTPEERRRLIRLRCDYQVQCTCRDQHFSARVVDIGLNGMRLFSEERLKTQSKLQIDRPDSVPELEAEQVLCQVRWCRKRRNSEGYEAGVQYSDTEGNVKRSWVRFLLKELGFDERSIFTRRKAVRAEGQVPAQLSGDDGRSLAGIVVNLGVGGAFFEGVASYDSGSAIRIRLGVGDRGKSLELPGSVVTTRFHSETETYQSSIRFSELSGPQVRLLGDYIIQLLKDQGPPCPREEPPGKAP